MKLTITSYVTAVDEQPEHGNHLRYSIRSERAGEIVNHQDLSELDVIEILTQDMKTDFSHFRVAKAEDFSK